MSSEESGSLADQAAAWVPPWARASVPTPSGETSAPDEAETPADPTAAPANDPSTAAAPEASDPSLEEVPVAEDAPADQPDPANEADLPAHHAERDADEDPVVVAEEQEDPVVVAEEQAGSIVQGDPAESIDHAEQDAEDEAPASTEPVTQAEPVDEPDLVDEPEPTDEADLVDEPEPVDEAEPVAETPDEPASVEQDESPAEHVPTDSPELVDEDESPKQDEPTASSTSADLTDATPDQTVQVPQPDEPERPGTVQDEELAPQLSDAELQGALEAILLVVDEPTTEIVLAQILEQPTDRISGMLYRLVQDYTDGGRGFELRRVAGGWRLYTRPEYAAYVEKFVLDGQQVRLTQAALETLAVVAYKQPVSRSRISAIRGVNCDGVVRTLVTRGLIEECGSEPDSGAFLYRTTTLFLEKLGLDGVDQLPPLAPFLPDDIDEIADAQR